MQTCTGFELVQVFCFCAGFGQRFADGLSDGIDGPPDDGDPACSRPGGVVVVNGEPQCFEQAPGELDREPVEADPGYRQLVDEVRVGGVVSGGLQLDELVLDPLLFLAEFGAAPVHALEEGAVELVGDFKASEQPSELQFRLVQGLAEHLGAVGAIGGLGPVERFEVHAEDLPAVGAERAVRLPDTYNEFQTENGRACPVNRRVRSWSRR